MNKAADGFGVAVARWRVARKVEARPHRIILNAFTTGAVLKRHGTTADVLLDPFTTAASKVSAEVCAKRLRQFQYDVSNNLGAADSEDRFTVTRTWTLKGLQHFLGEREYFESLLPAE